MDIFRLLRRKHADLSQSLVAWVRRPQGPGGMEAWAGWCERWEVHARVEENFLFPLLRDEPDLRHPLAQVGEAHGRVRKHLQSMPPYREDSDAWAEAVADLLESVEILMDLEEHGLFPRARAFLSKEESEDLALEVLDFLQGLRTALSAKP